MGSEMCIRDSCSTFLLWWVSCRQHMCGSCFLIHSAILCLLVGALNPLTFKVIIDRYLFIAIFSYLCSFLSVFLPVLEADPLASLAELVWRRYILCGFVSLESSLFGLPF